LRAKEEEQESKNNPKDTIDLEKYRLPNDKNTVTEESKTLTLEEILKKGKTTEDKLNTEEIKQSDINIIAQIVSLLEDAKRNWEKLYGAVETNKRIFLESELRFVDGRIKILEESISSITDCSASTVEDVARINTTYNNQIEEYKRIYQKTIDSRRAYGQEESAVTQEKELAEKIVQIERERDIEIEKIKVACESGSGLLKKSLQIVLDSVKRGRSDVSEYASSYSALQEAIKKEIESVELGREKTKSGQHEEAVALYDAHHQKIRSIILQLDQLNSSVERKVSSVDSSYKTGIDSAFRYVSIVQGVASELNAISNKAQEDYESWKVANTPTRCNATSEFSSGKLKTITTCSGAGTSTTNPLRCRSTSEWSSGKLNTIMICENN